MMSATCLTLDTSTFADWCKYNDCIIATGSVDKSVKVWDVRMPQRELLTMLGHG